MATKDATKLRTYNCTTIMELGRCKLQIENNDKYIKCIFFVVHGNGEALLGMPYIELLNILNINCNTIGTEKEGKGANCIMRLVKKVSSAVQIQAWKGVVIKQTAMQAATQTMAVFQI